MAASTRRDVWRRGDPVNRIYDYWTTILLEGLAAAANKVTVLWGETSENHRVDAPKNVCNDFLKVITLERPSSRTTIYRTTRRESGFIFSKMVEHGIGKSPRSMAIPAAIRSIVRV